MAVRARVKVIKFNAKGYTDALSEAIKVQIRQAAREWLRAVILKVPVYTGMARGSLVPLGRFLNVAIPISPDPLAAKRKYGNAASGELLGSFKFYQRTYNWVFVFNTEVPHYLINEFNVGLGSPPLRHPTPWQSFDAGKAAWLQYLNENLKRKLPKIEEYIATYEVR